MDRYVERWTAQGRDVRQWSHGHLHAAVGDFGLDSTAYDAESGFALLAGKAWHDDDTLATAQSIVEKGDNAEHRLNGTFAYVHLDPGGGDLRVVADRVGNQRIYYAVDGPNIVISSQYLPMARMRGFDAAVDKEGLMQFLCFGCCIGEYTLLKNVRTLEARHELRFRDGNVWKRMYWDFIFEHGDASRSVEDYASEYIDIMRASAKRHAGDHTVIPVTGGLDARLAACAASDVLDSGSVSTFTLGDPQRYDVQHGKMISQRLGFQHEGIPIPKTFFQDYAEEGVERTNGALIGHTCWRMAADEFLEARRGAKLFAGFWGEFMRWYSDDPEVEDQSDLEAVYRFHKANHKEWFWTQQSEVEKMLRPELRSQLDSFIDAVLRKNFMDAPAEHPRHKIEYVSAANWWPRRYGRMICDYWGAHCDVISPFNDMHAVEFGLKVPLETRRYGQINRWILKNLYPRVAAVPYTHTRMPYDATVFTNFYHRIMTTARYKLLPTLTGGQFGTENRAAYVHYRKWLRENNREFVRNVLAQTDLYDDVLDPHVVQSMFDDVVEGRSEDYGKIYNVATFIIWRKKLSNGS